jgi:hypothetical protein
MLALVEPFARRGHAADLAASRRARRRLAFQPRTAVTPRADGSGIREWLVLDSFESGTYRLVRTLECEGLTAMLRVTGRDPAELLQAVETFAPDRQFSMGGAVPAALSYELDPERRRILTRAVLRTAGVEMTLVLTAVRGVAADVAITATDGRELRLPEDLLAVLGWDWSPLVRKGAAWHARLRLRGTPEQRGRRAEAGLVRAGGHLARTLSEPPARFHERMRGARWWVVVRRTIPWLTVLALAGAAATLPRLLANPEPATVMLIFHVPTVLIAFSFCLQEQAKFEIPPRPSRSAAPDWRAQVAPEATRARATRWWNSPFR